MARNLTIQLDEKTIGRARVIAAERGTSVSGLIRQQIETLVTEADRYELAHREAARHLKTPPFRLGGRRATRESLHDRKGVRR